MIQMSNEQGSTIRQEIANNGVLVGNGRLSTNGARPTEWGERTASRNPYKKKTAVIV